MVIVRYPTKAPTLDNQLKKGTLDMVTTGQHSTKAAAASFIGTTIEWYDFYIYGFAAALVFAPLFFSGSSTYVGTLSAFATFAVGFLARPLGGLLFGHLGDRFGRRNMLVVTLMMMGIATVGIGLLPTQAQAGIWAPVGLVLLRLVQGFAVGGEWGGAVLLAAEHAPEGRKSYFASFAQLGSPAGLVLGLLAFRGIGLFDQSTLLGWGWRIPFLISFVLLAIGLLIRTQVPESPEFEAIRDRNRGSSAPILEVIKSWRVPIILAVGANTFGIGTVYLFNTFLIAYATQYLSIPRAMIFDVLLWAAIANFLTMPIIARISETFRDEKQFLQIALVWAMVMPYPLFLAMGTGNFWAILAGLVLNQLGGTATYAIIAGYLAGIFPTRVRYSAISIAYQFCGAIAGGLTPIAGLLLAEHFPGQWWPLAAFASVQAGISLICVTLIASYRASEEPLAQFDVTADHSVLRHTVET